METARPTRVRHTSSLYDFVKVRVWLSDPGVEPERQALPPAEAGGHSHVLSRFLVSRTLTASEVPYESAVKIALELKKHLVDSDMLDVSQAQLEALIFRFLRRRSFGEDHIARYRLLSSFHQRRQPLVILVCGSVFSHKTTIAAQLAQRLNFTNVVNLDWVHLMLHQKGEELFSCDVNGPLPSWGAQDMRVSVRTARCSRASRLERSATIQPAWHRPGHSCSRVPR